MVWRDSNAPGQGLDSAPTSSAKITVLVVMLAFLLITIALVTLQPSRDTFQPALSAGDAPEQMFSEQVFTEQETFDFAEPAATVLAEPEVVEPTATVNPEPVHAAVAPEPEPEPAPAPTPPSSPVVEPEVTRADASLLELRQSVMSNDASTVLRQLENQTGPSDLPLLARSVLGGFGYPVRTGDRLHALLVSALANQKSDAYIDALLNTAVARGEFVPPLTLQTPTGRIDTYALLQAMVRAAQG